MDISETLKDTDDILLGSILFVESVIALSHNKALLQRSLLRVISTKCVGNYNAVNW